MARIAGLILLLTAESRAQAVLGVIYGADCLHRVEFVTAGRATVVFCYTGDPAPALQWFNALNQRLELVRGSTAVPNSYAVDPALRQIAVVLDNTSSPRLTDLASGGGGLWSGAVVTSPASAVTTRGAVLNGTFGGSSGWFEWGATPALGQATDPMSLPGSFAGSVTLSNLTPATVYHFRARSEGACGTNLTFQTAAQPMLLNVTAWTNRTLRFQISGTHGQTYPLHVSADLATWDVFTNISMGPTNLTPWIELPATNSPARFFRLLVP